MSARILTQTMVVAPHRAAPQGERSGRVVLLGIAVAVLSSIALATVEPEAREGHGSHALAALLGLALPLAPLAIGMILLRARRTLASPLLLGGVPATLGLSAWGRGAVTVDPWLAIMSTATLLAYVIEVARLLALVEADIVPPFSTTARDVPARLGRREGVYRALQLVAIATFAVPLCVALLTPGKNRLLAVAAAVLLGALACRAFVIDLLARHLQGDEPLRDALAQMRRHARRGRPAFVFYIAAAVALVAMVLFAMRGSLVSFGATP